MALAQFAAHAVGPIVQMIANTLMAKVEHAPKCLRRPLPNSSPVFRSSRTRAAPPGLQCTTTHGPLSSRHNSLLSSDPHCQSCFLRLIFCMGRNLLPCRALAEVSLLPRLPHWYPRSIDATGLTTQSSASTAWLLSEEPPTMQYPRHIDAPNHNATHYLPYPQPFVSDSYHEIC